MIIHEYVNELIEERRKDIVNEGVIAKTIIKMILRKMAKPFAIACAYILLCLIEIVTRKIDNKNYFKKFLEKNPEFLSSINKISNNIIDIIMKPLDKYNSNYFLPKHEIENKDLKLSRDESSGLMTLKIIIMNFDEKLIFSELSEYESYEDYFVKWTGDETDEEKIKDIKELFDTIENTINELNIELAHKYKILKVTGNVIYEEMGGSSIELIYGVVFKITFDPNLQYKLDSELKKEITKQYNMIKPLVEKRLKLK